MQLDAGHDDHVAALEQRVGGGVAQLVDLVVARRVLLDVRVAARQVRLGLVVVEVADEVLDRVVREELAELGVELGRQRLVVGEHERRLVVLRDGPGEGGRLARPGGAQQRLVADARAEPVAQPLDRRRLVAGRLERGDELEVGHGCVQDTPFGRCEQVFAMRRSAAAERRGDRRLGSASAAPEVSMTRVAAGPQPPDEVALRVDAPPASAGSLPRPTTRSNWTPGSQVTSQTSSQSVGEPAVDEPDRLRRRPPRRRRPRPPSIAPRIRARAGGMDDRLEVAQGVGVVEDDRGRARRGRARPRRQHVLAEALDDGVERRLAGLHDLARHLVGVDHDDARLAGRASPRPWTCRNRSAR